MSEHEGCVKLFEILVPTKLPPDDKPIRTRYHRVWDRKVREISGGLTVLQPVNGQWVAPDGDVCLERMIPVRIACTEEQIHQIAELTQLYYQQQAVFYYLVSERVFIRNFLEKKGLKRAG